MVSLPGEELGQSGTLRISRSHVLAPRLTLCARVCTHVYEFVSIQHVHMSSQLLVWGLGFELRSPGLHSKHSYALSHLHGPLFLSFF